MSVTAGCFLKLASVTGTKERSIWGIGVFVLRRSLYASGVGVRVVNIVVTEVENQAHISCALEREISSALTEAPYPDADQDCA